MFRTYFREVNSGSQNDTDNINHNIVLFFLVELTMPNYNP
jgi:hypothetical protein